MVNQNWWFTTLLTQKFKFCPPLTANINCNVLIVGGGLSGIVAAVAFLKKRLKVVKIEKNIIGGSSIGKSAGFLTPGSELELHQLVRRYGIEAAREIWNAPCRGIDRIVGAIKNRISSADFPNRIPFSRVLENRVPSQLSLKWNVETSSDSQSRKLIIR